MDYISQQERKHPIGLGVAVALHIVVGWALMNGLAKKVVEVIKAPIETKIIEEVKPPPPPPPENLPPPPKMAAPPPPSFVPPPEIQVANPPPAPAITVSRDVPPPAPPVKIEAAPPVPNAPPAPPAPPAAPPAPKVQAQPAQINVNSCEKPEYPAAALRAEATGTTKIRFTVDGTGAVSKAEIERSSGPSREHRLLDRTAVEALSKCRFKPGIDEQGKPAGSTTLVDYVWKTE